MSSLINHCEPAADESAISLMIRSLSINSSSMREVLELVYGHSRRHIHAEAAPVFSRLTGTPLAWFERRLPTFVGQARWRQVTLFGHTWRDEWALRGTHQQICLQCVTDHGYGRAEWDLTAYTACHTHGSILLDHCEDCGRGISPDRPAIDVCSCGRYLRSFTRDAHPSVVAWSDLVARQVKSENALIEGCDLQLLEPLHGMTLDGAYRVLLAFGGGHQALTGRLLTGVAPWLRTADLHDLLAASLRRMPNPKTIPWSPRSEMQRCADSLAEQRLRGTSPFDRAAAGDLLAALGVPVRWRNRQPVYYDQQDLFR
jgi:hypothetical protein